jgi:hypothetical protein
MASVMDWVPMLQPFMMILTACLFSSSPVIIFTPVVIHENVDTITPGSFSGWPARRSILEISSSSSLCFEQVQHHVTDAKIAATIEKSCSKHKELEEEISKILLRAGQPEKEPGVMVSTFSWMTTGVKMMTGEDENKQAVKIIMNGCNMGTQSITEAMHQCKDASSESISIAKKLIGMEENLRDDMQKYL